MIQENHYPNGERFAEMKVEEQSKEQLIQRGLNGDTRSWTHFSRATRALCIDSLRVLGDPEDAEEAL